MGKEAVKQRPEVKHEIVPLGEKVSYALTNTGQTMIYGLFGMLMLYMTDYLHIRSATGFDYSPYEDIPTPLTIP